MDTINREEFDRRLDLATEQMRQKRVAMEAREAELADLIDRYAGVLERIRVESGPNADATLKEREELRNVLTELAERTSAVAAAL